MKRRPSEVLRQNLDLIRHVVALHMSHNPRVFGSVVRGEDTETSDLDLLVDPLPGATLLDLGAIQIELQESLGIGVDVLTPAICQKSSGTRYCVRQFPYERKAGSDPGNDPEIRS